MFGLQLLSSALGRYLALPVQVAGQEDVDMTARMATLQLLETVDRVREVVLEDCNGRV